MPWQTKKFETWGVDIGLRSLQQAVMGLKQSGKWCR